MTPQKKVIIQPCNTVVISKLLDDLLIKLSNNLLVR